jgi:hypothetical protein
MLAAGCSSKQPTSPATLARDHEVIRTDTADLARVESAARPFLQGDISDDQGALDQTRVEAALHAAKHKLGVAQNKLKADESDK